MHQLTEFSYGGQETLAMQQICTHTEPVWNVERGLAFQDLSPPPSSFGGFSATPVVALFFGPSRMRALQV
jgi:hypothetical protein